MKRLLYMLLILALLLSAAGCGENAGERSLPASTGTGENPAGPAGAAPVTLLTRGMDVEKGSPAAAAETSYTAVGDLGRALLPHVAGENPVFSPLSAYVVLSMAAEGARETTAKEFDALLGSDAETRGKTLQDLFALLDLLKDGNNDLALSNSFWVDPDAEIREEYLRRLAGIYRAEGYAGVLSSESLTQAMNDWVNEKTHGKIPALFSEPPDPKTVLILINTLYFKGAWREPFSTYSTREGTFRTESGASVSVPFMHNGDGRFEYFKSEDFAGVCLPFEGAAGKNAKMVLLMPRNISVRELAEKMDGKTLASLSGKQYMIDLSLPSFSAASGLNLKKILPGLGLASAFDPSTADFSGMGAGPSGGPLYIGSALQKVRIAVDEAGAEGAAASFVGMEEESEPIPDFSLTFDQPFYYAVLDGATGVPLFTGIVTDPSVKG